jgi:glycerol uptake facilitator-like aquaporin
LAVKAFVKISKTHFNHAVPLILNQWTYAPKQIVQYLSAQVIGAFAASAIIKYTIGNKSISSILNCLRFKIIKFMKIVHVYKKIINHILIKEIKLQIKIDVIM